MTMRIAGNLQKQSYAELGVENRQQLHSWRLSTEGGTVPAGAEAHINTCRLYGTTEVVP
jgi:hypothetical protein